MHSARPGGKHEREAKSARGAALAGGRAASDSEVSTTLFVDEWSTYRKMVDNNYLFHREAYRTLHDTLIAEVARPFRFLDVVCGDATASVPALKGTSIAHYHGIDISRAALAIAVHTVAELGCEVTLEQRDFVEALHAGTPATDVVWIGLSPHHLRTPAKLDLMRAVRPIVGEDGLFVFYEVTSPDGENRAEWLDRWEAQRADWAAYSDDEWDTVVDQFRAADFPEMVSTWYGLASPAGFSRVRELFVAPSALLRLYCFQA